MSTYSSDFRFQVPVAVHITAGSFGSTQSEQEFRLTIPVDWDHFWDNTRTDFYDVVLTDVDGVTKLSFRRVSADHAARTLVLEVDGWTAPSGQAVCMPWLHYGHSGASSDPVSVVTAAAPLTANLTVEKPGGWLAQYTPPRSATTDTWFKRSSEIRNLWVRLPALAQRRSVGRGVLGLEWPAYVKVDVFDDADPPVADPGVSAFSRIRFAGSQYVRVDLRSGSSGTTYAVTVTVTTNLGQRLVYPANLTVQD